MGGPNSSAAGQLGRYQVIKHLASGGMAQVLLARATGIEGFERYVVIKQIHVERASDPNVVKMFLDEARMSASLHHANIVQVTDIGQEKGEYFFAMEYVHGADVRKLLTQVSSKKMYIPTEHVLTIVTSVAAALHYAHELRGPDRKPLEIVHRDVSPANILVGYDGQVKVVDFGIAKAAQRSIETQSGTLKGKISYMPPEQCLGQPVDRRGDVFSLGIVLYELFTVRRLFKGASDYLTMTAVVQGQFVRPSVHRPDMPPELEKIILKALALSPADRYQTADELRIALQKFATAANIRTSTTELADFMVQQFGQRPEPWLVESDEPEPALSADFDGSESELVEAARTSPPPIIATPPPGSLFARIRRKAMRAVTPGPGRIASEWGAGDNAPTTASGTPMAWAPSGTSPAIKPRRRWGIAIGFAVPLVIFAIVAIATRSSSTGNSENAASAPKLEMAPAAIVAPATNDVPAAPPTPPPAAAEPVEEIVTPPEPAKPAEETKKPPVKPAPAKAKPDPAKDVTKPAPTQKRFDAKSLFPK